MQFFFELVYHALRSFVDLSYSWYLLLIACLLLGILFLLLILIRYLLLVAS